MNYFAFFVSLILGYSFNRLATKPNSRVNRNLPTIQIKFIQVFPRVKINFKNNSIHIHHWLTYTIILIITLTLNAGFLDTLYSKGYLVGSVLQGFTFPDWKKIVVKNAN